MYAWYGCYEITHIQPLQYYSEPLRPAPRLLQKIPAHKPEPCLCLGVWCVSAMLFRIGFGICTKEQQSANGVDWRRTAKTGCQHAECLMRRQSWFRFNLTQPYRGDTKQLFARIESLTRIIALLCSPTEAYPTKLLGFMFMEMAANIKTFFLQAATCSFFVWHQRLLFI